MSFYSRAREVSPSLSILLRVSARPLVLEVNSSRLLKLVSTDSTVLVILSMVAILGFMSSREVTTLRASSSLIKLAFLVLAFSRAYCLIWSLAVAMES